MNDTEFEKGIREDFEAFYRNTLDLSSWRDRQIDGGYQFNETRIAWSAYRERANKDRAEVEELKSGNSLMKIKLRDENKQFIAENIKLKAEIEALKKQVREMDNWFYSHMDCNFHAVKDARIPFDEIVVKLKELVKEAMPCMRYIHAKLPEGSEVLSKYREWLEKAKGAIE